MSFFFFYTIHCGVPYSEKKKDLLVWRDSEDKCSKFD